jgi:galactonate dehydratase
MALRRPRPRVSRRSFVRSTALTTAALAAPAILRAQRPLTLRFRTIPDPDGWHPALRLKGDWLVVELSDGVLSGFGEASHSNDDKRCMQATEQLFAKHYAGFVPSLEGLARKARAITGLNADLVTATAFSALNQAFYDLLARREQVPVWRLLTNKAPFAGLQLYTTINRSLQTRTAQEYSAIVGEARRQGFRIFKCAPFEAVSGPDAAVAKSAAGVATLQRLRDEFPDLAIRVDFHERFARPEDFYSLLPQLERLKLDWIEEPFTLGPAYAELKRRTRLRVSAGELFWGGNRFAEIRQRRWADVIMPDVKHVGGFGPLLDVMRAGAGAIEVSPHNPAGPISTAASLHAAVVHPDVVRTLEYSFDRNQTRRKTGERVESGVLLLNDKPGWGVEPPA